MTEWKPTKTQIEAGARADGFHESNLVIPERGVMWIDREGCYYGRENLPDYATDHTAVQRLVQGLSWLDVEQYHIRLCEICKVSSTDGSICMVHRATCAQKFQAVCKAKGWE